MNKVIAIGNVGKEPDVRVSTTNNLSVARYSLALANGENTTWINCVAFGKSADFVEKYVKKGMKIAIEGHIQTGSYKDKDGKTVYTTDIVVDRHEFCESKKSDGMAQISTQVEVDDFMGIPEGLEDELPFE